MNKLSGDEIIELAEFVANHPFSLITQSIESEAALRALSVLAAKEGAKSRDDFALAFATVIRDLPDFYVIALLKARKHINHEFQKKGE